MAYLDNNVLTVNAILTKKGREILAKTGGLNQVINKKKVAVVIKNNDTNLYVFHKSIDVHYNIHS